MSESPFHRAAAITLVVQSSAFCQATFCFRLPSNYSAEGKQKKANNQRGCHVLMCLLARLNDNDDDGSSLKLSH